ncbi:hypothetical protein K469DRAFT_686738 [Zopfia rhizophila CBS 207.26]|uniref:C2H2-type domain-containing protein n=1 Tax=Zopfia rhizophila CBS 207.26 TaxID=1314779 RepID=A0A6A6ERH9_9PEZI|nr:hypothetical protein K469DRAFT_686738 [Zopfia rhizophila CBS 207.26]
MTITGAVGYRQLDSKDGFQAPQSGALSSGFLTPASSASEGRRDSIASSQSSFSYCQSFTSDYSIHTDYSIPITPNSGRSLLVDNSYIDLMAYESRQGVTEKAFHGLPLSLSSKTPILGDSYETWVMVSRPEEPSSSQTMPFSQHDVLPAAADFSLALRAVVDQRPSQEQVMNTTAGQGWEILPAKQWPEMHRQQQLMQQLPLDLGNEMRDGWNTDVVPSLERSHGMFLETVMPSDAILKGQDEYMYMSDGFEDMSTYANPSASFPPSPQEVCFKREESTAIKGEPGTGESDETMTRSIYVSPTGGKGVKKERRSRGVPKKRSKILRHRPEILDPPEGKWYIELEGGIRRDERTGKWIGSHRQKKYVCGEIVGGRECRNRFARPEHLKRHKETHTGDRKFWCKICQKLFNRNDNCQEHYWTHVERPGKKTGRNKKMSLREVEKIAGDVKVIEKMRHKWAMEFEQLMRV